jgi:hypothetical protein
MGAAPDVKAMGAWVTGYADGFGCKLIIGRRDNGCFLMDLVFPGITDNHVLEMADEAQLAAGVEAWKNELRRVGWPEPVWVSVEQLLAEIETAGGR